jgi:hypothetical protein
MQWLKVSCHQPQRSEHYGHKLSSSEVPQIFLERNLTPFCLPEASLLCSLLFTRSILKKQQVPTHSILGTTQVPLYLFLPQMTATLPFMSAYVALGLLGRREMLLFKYHGTKNIDVIYFMKRSLHVVNADQRNTVRVGCSYRVRYPPVRYTHLRLEKAIRTDLSLLHES